MKWKMSNTLRCCLIIDLLILIPVLKSQDLNKSSSGEATVQKIISEHNRIRREHNASDLRTNNSDLFRFAEEWASSAASKGVLKHRIENKYGENVCSLSGREEDLMERDELNPVLIWFDERLYWGSLRQFIDAEVHYIGCGIDSSYGNVYVVCNYYPKVNVHILPRVDMALGRTRRAGLTELTAIKVEKPAQIDVVNILAAGIVTVTLISALVYILWEALPQ